MFRLAENDELVAHFFKELDIQQDFSEVAYFTGSMSPVIDDAKLLEMVLIGAKFNIAITCVSSKEELADHLIHAFIDNKQLVKYDMQRLFNPWRF